MGFYYNWVQVFGTHKWLWFLPVFMESGKPLGDGVVWPTKKEISMENATAYQIGADTPSVAQHAISSATGKNHGLTS